ncbi:hypothetical protein SUNI508_09505 [Seiridium unicorne]|uniref:Uncharacterized protein n=1 Tax=Seiridium unicorne TaxID=138068 RepID=A0ABR2UQ92_9PEZI
MSAEAGVEAAAPNLNLSPEEKRIYGQLFRHADTDNVGVVTGEVAVKFFEKTRLDSRVLGEIWQIADRENRGFLTPAGFSIVLRLIGHAQAGREPTQEVALQQGPIPRFDGFTPTPAAPPPAQPLQAQGTGGAPIRIPPLTPEKVSQYAGLFERQNLQGGNMLPGDQARNIFEKSGLPIELLGRIWQLADTEQRGALVLTEFVIAMHLLTSLKTGQLRGLPNVLPAALYEAATRRGAAPRQSPTTTGPPLSAIPRQLSGQAPLRQSSPLGRAPLSAQGTGLQPQTTGSDWAITPADKARFDQLYADLDKTNKGFITGEEAVPFLSQSSLPEDALAQIWDLADINSQGHLNRDTFAVAMYLIRQQRSRRDGSNTLPSTLPANLVPPSLRTQARPPTAGASPFDAPEPPKPQPPPAPKSALDDLFGLDAPTPAPMQAAMATGGSASKDPFANASPIAPASPIRASPTGNQFKPFIPSSSFGRTLQTHDTGGSTGSKPGSAVDDLLGDNDPEISKKLTNETAELANLSNQIGSLSNQMQQVQGQRTVTQKEVNQTSQQKKNFEDRLAQLRALYEKEAKEVADLKDQLQKSQNETRKLITEMTTIDGSYRDIQAQHQQLAAALQADQQENQSLKQKISTVNAEIAQLKPQIEKLKSDARQQKGLVAINKKQLSTVEGEREKLKTEAEDLTRSNDELARQINTSSPVTAPAQVASPALSTTSANNPFFKRSGSTDMMGAFSPPPKAYNDKSFDDIFGGFGTGSTSSTPPPPTSFKAQHTGTSTASAGSFAPPASSSPATTTRQATLNAAEPPPPPASRQISSSFLPFGDVSESLTSSRQASPPLSRVGESSTPTATTTANPLEPHATGGSAASTPDTPKSAGPVGDAASTSNGTIPGAFPEDTPRAELGGATPSFAGNRDSEIFEGLKKDPLNAKDDFDSAFASFGSSNKSQDKPNDNTNAFGTFNTEFPPISELERDDDSDSASEGNGFDDDFAPPSSPPSKKIEGKDTPKAPSSPVANHKTTAVPDVPAAEGASTTSQPPHDPAPSFVQPLESSPGPARKAQADDPFAPASDFAPAPSTVTNTAPVNSKNAFDDLEDDFEGLEDAKEGSGDDEFANISRSNLEDFNPVFDSSPPPSQPKSESTNVSNAFGIDSSYDFGTVASNSAVPSQQATNAGPAAVPNAGAKAPDNHDWDSIFADLDEPSAAATNEIEKPNSPNQSLSSGRPSLQNTGRALTQEGVHDDPILKNLTGMGYSRTDALNALEKYDYNLERMARPSLSMIYLRLRLFLGIRFAM